MPAKDDENKQDRFVLSRAKPSPAAQTTPRVRLEEYRRELAGQVEWFEQVKSFVGGRVQMLRFTLSLQKLSAVQQQQGLTSLRPDTRGMVEALLAQMVRDPMLAGRMSMAVTRYDAAAELIKQVQGFLADSGDRTAGSLFRFMAEHDIAKVRGQLYSITTFDALFRDDPVLGQVFPPVARESRLEPDGPRAVTRRLELEANPHRSKLSLPGHKPAPVLPPQPMSAAPPDPEPQPPPTAPPATYLQSLINRCQQLIDSQPPASGS